MKNLSKIPRNYRAKFCFFGIENHDYAEEIEKIELTEEGKNKKEELNNQELINRAVNAASMGAEKMPDGFEKIPGSEFLKRSAEDLRTLFIVDGVVNFRGNYSAYQAVGFIDLFPKVSEKQQFLVISGVSYAYGARRGDGKAGYGKEVLTEAGKKVIGYKKMEDNVRVDFFISPPKEENGQNTENYISFVEEDGQKTPPGEEFHYEKLLKNSANYLDKMEMGDLTPEEEGREKRQFLRKTRRNERRQKRQINKYERIIQRQGRQSEKLREANNVEYLSISEKKIHIHNFFIGKGYTAEQAAGIIGNLTVESDNFSPDVISGKRRGDGGVAYGIAQWHPKRQVNFVKAFGKTIQESSFEEQVEFIYWELQNTETRANSFLKNTSSAAEAAYVFDKYYERSSGAHRDRRIAIANNINNQYDNLA